MGSLNSAISGSTGFPSFTWATKPASWGVGQPVYISDFGINGSHWVYTNAVWRPLGPQLMKSQTALSGAFTSETIVLQQAFPAGGLQVGNYLRGEWTLTKTGTSSVAQSQMKLGTLGTTGDIAIFNSGAAGMAASQKNLGIIVEARIEDATHTQVLARTDLGYGGGTSNVVPAQSTVTSMTNILFCSITATSTGDSLIMSDAKIWLIPGS